MSAQAFEIKQHPSPNFGPRRDRAVPSLVVLHYTAMDSAEGACKALCDPAREVSAHYLISQKGAILQLVSEEMRAWHAGAGRWGDITDVNSHSIGIELDNTGDCPFAEPQMAALEWLLPNVLKRWGISASGVIGHSDFAPHRKIDPGRHFDWKRLARQGLAVWPDDQAGEVDWAEGARSFGFPVDGFAEGETLKEACFQGFRLRFRPWATGAEDAEDRRIMARLIAQD